jgi:general stress protein CsbA
MRHDPVGTWRATMAARWRFAALVGALAAALFMRLAWRTVSDADEGYYAVAGELVASGKTLYRDFFFPQAPLVPYLLGALWRVVHLTLRGQRFVMALFGGVTAGAIAHTVRSETRSRVAGVIGALFFVVHELSWQWVPVVKTYAVASALSLLAVVLVTRPQRPSLRACALAGALAGLAISARLLEAPVLPVVMLAAALREVRAPFARGLSIAAVVVVLAARHAPPSVAVAAVAAVIALSLLLVGAPLWRTVKPALAVATGCAVVAVPVWLLYLEDPAAFVFGNFGYHAQRGDGGLLGNVESARNMFYAVVGVDKVSTFSAAGPQFLLLGILTAVSLTQRTRDRRLAPALAGVLLVIASLKPNGLHEQYFVIAVPFFALCAGMAVGDALEERGRRGVRRYGWPIAVAAAYLLLSYPSWDRKWNLAIYDPEDMATARPRITEFTAAVVHRVWAQHPGPILPTWPGSALGSGAAIMPGFEDHFARQVADKLTVDERARYHVATTADLATAVTSRTPSVVVLDRELSRSGSDGLRETLRRSGYERRQQTAAAEIFVRVSMPSARSGGAVSP